ncbi:MAG: exonuclease domain-containing protein [Planctomycetota bacterium]
MSAQLPTDFTAIDVETANADMSSICQIGLVRFGAGKPTDEWCSLVDPEDYFDDINIDIHGITEDDVVGAPKLPEVADKLHGYLDGAVAVSHTHFDRVSVLSEPSTYGGGPGEVSPTRSKV